MNEYEGPVLRSMSYYLKEVLTVQHPCPLRLFSHQIVTLRSHSKTTLQGSSGIVNSFHIDIRCCPSRIILRTHIPSESLQYSVGNMCIPADFLSPLALGLLLPGMFPGRWSPRMVLKFFRSHFRSCIGLCSVLSLSGPSFFLILWCSCSQ
jgi:hypothetical protein